MSFLKKLFSAFILILPVIFTACSSNDNDYEGGGTEQETILLSSIELVEEKSAMGMKFNYNNENQLTEGYNYTLSENFTDTSDYFKYVFDRSVKDIITVEKFFYDKKEKAWGKTNEKKKLYYNGRNISKIETFDNKTLSETEVYTWQGNKVTYWYSENYIRDSAWYINGNYVDHEPIVTELSYSDKYSKIIHSTVSTFNSYRNHFNLIPVEYALVMSKRQTVFPLNVYFSDNELINKVETILTDNYKPDRVRRTTTTTNTVTTDYTYTFGKLTKIYPISLTQIETTNYNSIDHTDPVSNFERKPIVTKTVVNFALSKKQRMIV